MDGKSNWDNIKFCVGLSIGFVVSFLFCNWKFQQEVDRVNRNYQSLVEKKDSLLNELKKNDAEILILQDSLKQKKEKIVYIRIKGHEKMDSVRHLPLDEAMEFFSKSLSSEIGY
jgi:uncharacterized membrane protein YgaE (UPF0421/DUF939 family)